MIARNPGETASWFIMTFKFPVVGKPIKDSPLGLVSLPFLYKMKIAFIALYWSKGPALIFSSYFALWPLLRCSQDCIYETIFFFMARVLSWSLTEYLFLLEKRVLNVALGNLKMGSSPHCPHELWATLEKESQECGSSLKVLTERKAAGAMMRKRKQVEVLSSPSRPGLDRSVVLRESKSCTLVRLCQLLLPVDFIL